MVEVTEPYVFHGVHGRLRLVDLFEGRQQLMVYHFMWPFDADGQPKDAGCPSCSGFAEQILPSSLLPHTSTPDLEGAGALRDWGEAATPQSPVGEMRNSAMSLRPRSDSDRRLTAVASRLCTTMRYSMPSP